MTDPHKHLVPRSLNIKHELNRIGWFLEDDSMEGLKWVFGMHMAFDPEYSRKLEAKVDLFGWQIVEREHPDDHRALGTDDEDPHLLEALVTMADDYKHQLLGRLAAQWLKED